jgi:sorbitol-specific phosphotransferase system component IIBC
VLPLATCVASMTSAVCWLSLLVPVKVSGPVGAVSPVVGVIVSTSSGTLAASLLRKETPLPVR